MSRPPRPPVPEVSPCCPSSASSSGQSAPGLLGSRGPGTQSWLLWLPGGSGHPPREGDIVKVNETKS